LQQVCAQGKKLKKYQSQAATTEKEMKSLQETHSVCSIFIAYRSLICCLQNCQLALEEIGRDLRAAQLQDATSQKELTAVRDVHSVCSFRSLIDGLLCCLQKCESSLEEAHRRLQEAQSQDTTTQKELRSLREAHSVRSYMNL
jgi:hypothetical protein